MGFQLFRVSRGLSRAISGAANHIYLARLMPCSCRRLLLLVNQVPRGTHPLGVLPSAECIIKNWRWCINLIQPFATGEHLVDAWGHLVQFWSVSESCLALVNMCYGLGVNARVGDARPLLLLFGVVLIPNPQTSSPSIFDKQFASTNDASKHLFSNKFVYLRINASVS